MARPGRRVRFSYRPVKVTRMSSRLPRLRSCRNCRLSIYSGCNCLKHERFDRLGRKCQKNRPEDSFFDHIRYCISGNTMLETVKKMGVRTYITWVYYSSLQTFIFFIAATPVRPGRRRNGDRQECHRKSFTGVEHDLLFRGKHGGAVQCFFGPDEVDGGRE